MHAPSLPPDVNPAAQDARQGHASALALALSASRRDTLATFAVFEQGLPGLAVPQLAELNPPLWELGHIGWFADHWLARNPVRGQGAAADPDLPRSPARRADADALYDSSHVPHESRWTLPLPTPDATRADLAQQLADTLALLDSLGSRNASNASNASALYFFRLALLHEDMHHEAALYTAQHLGLPVTDPRWQAAPLPDPPAALDLSAAEWLLGGAADQSDHPDHPGFAFDNELGAHAVRLDGFSIDAQAVRWAEYLPAVDAGAAPVPRYLKRNGRSWLQWRHGQWQALDLRQAACHLSQPEALAWCAWAGRRLPSEAEWERAAGSLGPAFRWGDVWEWTASAFAPYPGFVPHPYRDYSAPWFDGRPVLRGASFMTQPRMRHLRYRNYFPAQRNDIAAGFRSCAR